jgi:hypothetical protein
VRVLGTANERKIWPRGKPFVAIGVQSDTQQDCLAFFLLRCVRHQFKLSAAGIGVKRVPIE